MTEFERVIELIDWYDGPREGLATFRGRPYSFKSRMLDVSGSDHTQDLFDLMPTEPNLSPLIARAEFRRIGSGPLPAGDWPALEVRWAPVGADGAQQFIQADAASRRGLIQALGRMDTWQPISAEELEALVTRQLSDCSPDIQQLYERFKVVPYRAKIDRLGTTETAFVVAKSGNIALYYEDIEDGFNISELRPDGAISIRACEQWELSHALLHLAAA